MKIVFVYLPHPYLAQPESQVPLGLLYLKAVLNDKRPDIECEVCNFTSYATYDHAVEHLPEADIYGITVTSLEIPIANDFSKLIKEKYPNSKIILGGPGIDPQRSFLDFISVDIDSVVIGEGEHTIFQLIEDYEQDNLFYIYDGVPIRHLDYLPFPDRECLGEHQGNNIFAYNKKFKGDKSTVILTSRGCPFSCSFCSSAKYRGVPPVRFRSVYNVYQEVKHVIENLEIYQYRFSDDMFTARPRDKFKKLCELLKSLGIVFRVSCRVKPFDSEIAETLVDAGCREISFGIESFDDHVLKFLNKRTTAEENLKAIKIAKEAGLMVRALMMIRTPGQRKETVDINIEYLEKSPHDIATCSSFVPLPGSDIWNNPERYHIEILTKDLSKYNFFFYGKHGENELHDIIKLKGRSLKEFNEETIKFKNYIRESGKLNRG